MKNSKNLRKLRYWRFIYSPALKENKPESLSSDATLLLTIAYNEASFIEQQIFLLKKYFTDPFCHIVVDNSTDPSIRKAIERICQANQVGYAAVPKNPYSNTKSHAAAMHWAYFQLVKTVSFCDLDFWIMISFRLPHILFSQK